MHDESIPKSKIVKPMQIDCSEDIAHGGFDHIHFREGLNTPLRQIRVHFELASNCGEVLLKHLERYHPNLQAKVIRDESEGPQLLCSISRIIGVYEDVRIKKTA